MLDGEMSSHLAWKDLTRGTINSKMDSFHVILAIVRQIKKMHLID